jgi:hypothetical protein
MPYLADAAQLTMNGAKAAADAIDAADPAETMENDVDNDVGDSIVVEQGGSKKKKKRKSRPKSKRGLVRYSVPLLRHFSKQSLVGQTHGLRGVPRGRASSP